MFKHFFECMYLTFNYQTFSLNFIYLHVTSMVCFKAKFLLGTIKYYLILNYPEPTNKERERERERKANPQPNKYDEYTIT